MSFWYKIIFIQIACFEADANYERSETCETPDIGRLSL